MLERWDVVVVLLAWQVWCVSMFYPQNVLSLWFRLCFCLSWSPFSPWYVTLYPVPLSCLHSHGVPIRSSLSYPVLSGVAPDTRSLSKVRARPAPEPSLVVKGQQGECVRPSRCLSASVCLSACMSLTGLTWWCCVWRTLNVGWFSRQENRGLHLCVMSRWLWYVYFLYLWSYPDRHNRRV